jgi:prepilin-type N-terminal cleavage/methylation domain-containing protein
LRHIRPIDSPLLNRREAGYTLIEMVMVIAILGLLSLAINQAIAQTVRISSHGTDSMTAIKQVEDTFYWVNIDTQQSQVIKPGLNGGFPLKLTWTEWNGTRHAVTYSIDGRDMKRSVSINEGPATGMVVARYLVTDASATNCRVTGSGTFSLPDVGDSFTITGGQQASSGNITATVGGMTVITTGSATYTGTATSGNWSTPHAGDSIAIIARDSSTRGTWTSDNTSALLGLTQDYDKDAVLSGSALMLILTASGGDESPYQETRQGLVFSRS